MAAPQRSLRILQVGSSLHDWGGIERYVATLSKGLKDRGHSVQVVAPPGSPLLKRTGGVAFGTRSKRNPLLFLRWHSILRREGPEVIQTHFSPDFLMPAWAASRLGVRAVLTRHLALPWSARKASATLRHYQRVIAVSGAVRDVLAPTVDPGLIRVVYAGVDPLTAPRPPREGAFVVGSFGRLVPEKGVDLLLEAVRDLAGVEVRIYGDGPDRARLEGIGPANTKFFGQIPDVAAAMAACDAVAIPSRWAEAFPIASLEAMSLGLPVIASRTGGLPEQVVDGETGLLCPPEDATALRVAIHAMKEMPDRGASLGAAGMARQRERFSVEAFARSTEVVLAEALCP